MIGSLFSGIAGLELGLLAAGFGPVSWQVELDPFCREILAQHFPAADRSVHDVRLASPATLARVGIICGGFPCQDVSSAGKRAGLEGARSGLWREFARVVGALRPSCVLVENVASGARQWLPTVRRDLHLLGYRTRALGIAARDVGAPHWRRRIFVVAYGDGFPCDVRAAAGGENSDTARDSIGVVSNAVRMFVREQSRGSGGKTRPGQGESPDDGEARGWAPLPSIRRNVDGVSARLDEARLKALGNSVVPQCAQVAGLVLRSWLAEAKVATLEERNDDSRLMCAQHVP